MVGPATVSLRMCAAPLLDLALAVVEVAKLAPMRRILLIAVEAVLLLVSRSGDA